MEAIIEDYLRKDYVEGELFKIVMEEGTEEIPLNSLVSVRQTIYTEQGELLKEEHEHIYRIIDFKEADPPAFQKKLLTMKVNEQSYLWLNIGEHSYTEDPWYGYWYNMSIKSIDTNIDAPQEERKEYRTEVVGELVKNIVIEGVGKRAGINSAVSFIYKLIDSTDKTLEYIEEFSYLTSPEPKRSFHRGIQIMLTSMCESEESYAILKPDQHLLSETSDVTAVVTVNSIIHNYPRVIPQEQEFIREVQLGEVTKRVVAEGDGMLVPQEFEIWMNIQGRLDDGFEFQKVHSPIFIHDKPSNMVCFDWKYLFESMQRKEKAWFCFPPGTHTKKIYERETLWFLIECFEVREIRANKLPADATPLEKVQRAKLHIEDGNRLYRSDLISRSKTLYNEANTMLIVKKAVFENLEEPIRQEILGNKARAFCNLALCHMKDAANSQPAQRAKHLNDAIKKCEEVYKIEPDNVKAMYLHASCLVRKELFMEAEEKINCCLQAEPENQSFLNLKKKIESKTKTAADKEKDLYKAIFRKMPEEQRKEEEVRRQIQKEERRIRLMNQEYDDDFSDYTEVSIEDATEGFIFDHSTNTAERVNK